MSNTHTNGQSKSKTKIVPQMQIAPGSFVPVADLASAAIKLKDEKVIQAVVMSPHGSISNDASQMVELAAKLATATNTFNTDVATTIAHLRDELDNLAKHEEKLARYYDEELSEMQQRHADNLNELKRIQQAELDAFVKSNDNAKLLLMNQRTTFVVLLEKFSKSEPQESQS